MDSIHLHLILNHIPILGTLFSALLLIVGMILRNRTVEITALATLVLVGLLTIPTYTSGEEAEHKVEHMVGVDDHELEEHEEHAELTMWLTIAAGALALFTLLTYRQLPNWVVWIRTTTLLFCIGAFLSMIPLALHGGKIMHSELRDDGTARSQSVESGEVEQEH